MFDVRLPTQRINTMEINKMTKGTMNTIHNLKIRSVDFNAINGGDKKAEFRINDHEYKKGDFLGLHEIDDNDNFTSDSIFVKVTDVTVIDSDLYPQIGGEFVLLSFELSSMSYVFA
ncbi:DUF3850 domain-containing protein [Xenorhabdus hominickii]|uniref:DUF3850 domain-containing protein n=1 Tax=Xenorhabdus hominickii TaxID=351679 RepID=A0A2G0QG62_XENHO|nr:DUF3850 domain-containing protein [Xenorhabdus hominickii]AOM42220.1 hypothetical protein A9255_17655 [Xenorhabdus hominickii]PHM58220.1 hypothetical protein Xhom_01233 [Xenorhabdus hominickii]